MGSSYDNPNPEGSMGRETAAPPMLVSCLNAEVRPVGARSSGPPASQQAVQPEFLFRPAEGPITRVTPSTFSDLGPSKECTRCHRRKPLTEFTIDRPRPGRKYPCHNKDGRHSHCRECQIEIVHDWKKRNPERAKETALRASNRYVENHREGARAHRLLRAAIKRGDLMREPCKACGSKRGIQGHHDDYSKPLEVTWLCHDCHRRLHRLPAPSGQPVESIAHAGDQKSRGDHVHPELENGVRALAGVGTDVRPVGGGGLRGDSADGGMRPLLGPRERPESRPRPDERVSPGTVPAEHRDSSAAVSTLLAQTATVADVTPCESSSGQSAAPSSCPSTLPRPEGSAAP